MLDIDQLSCDEMIAKYKKQQSSERGFAFLKDPLFFTDSVFLKSPERIEALALVMGLCLLVYTLGQRYLCSRLMKIIILLRSFEYFYLKTLAFSHYHQPLSPCDS